MKKLHLLFIFIILFSPCAAYSATGSISLTTYYPAPLGAYDTFRLIPKTTGNDYSGACNNGTLYVNSSGDIQFCKNSVWGPIGGGGSSPSDLWQPGSNNSIYLNTSYNKVGIGYTSTTSPPFSLGVIGDGIFASGSGSGEQFPTLTGAGNYVFMWYPKKAAFRTGYFKSANWTEANIGSDSWAGGFNSRAIGQCSIALGSEAVARGDDSVAFGYYASASGLGSVAMGYSTQAKGDYSVALGYGSQAGSKASDYAAIALGHNAKTLAPFSVAIGENITVGDGTTVMAGWLDFYGPTHIVGISLSSTPYTVTQTNTMAIMGGQVGIGTTIISKTPFSPLAIAGLPAGTINMPYLVADSYGNVYTYGTAVCTSSRKYKKNIKPLKDDFYGILKVEPKSFVFKSNNEPDIGVIAEDVDDLGLKNLVVYSKEGEPDAFKYEKVPLYMLMIIKDQEKEIKQLSAIVCQDHPNAELCK